jgi:hypothetical protein
MYNQHTPARTRVNKVRNRTHITVDGAVVRQEESILLHDDEVRSAWARKIEKKNRDRKIEHDEALQGS